MNYVGEEPRGPAIAQWPKWLDQGGPDPSGRITFTTWRHWHAEDELLPSGLLGPVSLEVPK